MPSSLSCPSKEIHPRALRSKKAHSALEPTQEYTLFHFHSVHYPFLVAGDSWKRYVGYVQRADTNVSCTKSVMPSRCFLVSHPIELLLESRRTSTCTRGTQVTRKKRRGDRRVPVYINLPRGRLRNVRVHRVRKPRKSGFSLAISSNAISTCVAKGASCRFFRYF